MRPPIIISESGDVSIFQSIEDAERYLESPDVLDNRYVAYDSEGRLLKLDAPPTKAHKFLGITIRSVDKIAISSEEYQPSHAKELKEILKKTLEHRGVSVEWLRKATMNELLRKNVDFLGFTK